MRVRKNIFALTDDTLYWYSKAVENLKARPINDPTSWWYLGAVHGFPADPKLSTYWCDATGVGASETLFHDLYWRQRPIATRYVIPWFRIYLYYFERIVADAVIEEGGPSDWALPYWNLCLDLNKGSAICKQTEVVKVPKQFGDAQEPNSQYPGLWIKGRRIPNLNNRHSLRLLALTNQINHTDKSGVNDAEMNHFTEMSHKIETDMNSVCVEMGGALAKPETAALDPIFWLFHANMDRLWQQWSNLPHNDNPTDSKWRKHAFMFHDATGALVTTNVEQVLCTSQLNYCYQ